MYYTFVYPYLIYCNLIWGSAAKSHLQKLVLLQKRIIRIICKVGFRDHTEHLFKECKILKIHDIHTYQCSVFMFKYQHSLLPNIFQNMFTLNCNIHIHRTRQNNMYWLSQCRTSLRQCSISYKVPKIWNSLMSHNLDTSGSLYIFKKQLKLYLLHLPY